MSSRERAATEGARRRLVASRQSSRLAGRIADPPLPLPSCGKSVRGHGASAEPAPGKLLWLPGSLPRRGSGDELLVHDPSLGHSPHIGEEAGPAPGVASDGRLESSLHQKSPASEPGASRSALFQSARSLLREPIPRKREEQRKLSKFLPTELHQPQQTQWAEKDVQEGIQNISVRGDVPHGQTNPGNFPIHRWSEKEPSRETELDGYVSK